ncbi:lytic transglycosylase domain-containing protein [Cupriavidus respiraculi]|nr:lytic transglycosylase domain-containing protein [Cupriavidus respiraculi]
MGLLGIVATLAVQPVAAMVRSSVERGFERMAAECAPTVPAQTLRAVVRTESSWNPYAIGMVGGRLVRQPVTHAEAVATARALFARGYNFSLGLTQVNRTNLAAYGETLETVLKPCRNLRVGGAILADCFERARPRFLEQAAAWRAALSCYYSGDFARGLRPDVAGGTSYVERVLANAATAEADAAANADASVPMPIPVVPSVPRTPLSAAGARSSGATDRVRARPGRPVEASGQTPPSWIVFVDEVSPTDGVLPAAGTGGGSQAKSAAPVVRALPSPAGSDEAFVRISP